MKHILLPNGANAIFDDEDFELVNKHKWKCQKISNLIYAIAFIDGKIISMQRLIMKTPPKMSTDHKDHNTLNNQKSNLRICTHSENMRNRNPSKNGRSKYLGVYYDVGSKNKKHWRAELRHNKIKYSGGRHFTEQEAAKKYNELALIHHGDFARLNTF